MDNNPSFRGEYSFLSNFYNIRYNLINFEGDDFQNVESAFHASKLLKENRSIYFNTSAIESKKLSKKYKIENKDFKENQLIIMETLLRSKFKHPFLKEKLLSTNELELIERNWWGDVYWGVCKGKGENNLGKILMKIRSDI